MDEIKWTNKDFDVFTTDGLEQRMEALTTNIRPKFQELGERYASFFSVSIGNEFFPHVAKHARRTINPPKDSWVAFSTYKRGYKSLPHFQIGLWNTHLFIWVAIIYEAPEKDAMANRLLQNIEVFNKLPDDFVISGDHMKPDALSLIESKGDTLEELLVRLRDVKKGEFLVGRQIPREEAVTLSSDEFLKLTDETFEKLLPIYNVIVGR
ncbi:YktB family protein [Ureibacillus sp. NPDC094379]